MMGILDVLLIIFIVLKLVGVVTWSWWFVLAPGWVPLLIILIKFVSMWIGDFFDDVSYF